MTSRFVAAVCNSNSKLDTREVKKLNGTSEKMAMPRPQAVAISASAIPPVTACTASSSLPRKLNERIRPVIVPKRPSKGANVTSVSITTRKRPARLISMPAATCNAPCSEACWWFKPFHIIRNTGSRDPRERREASATSPVSIAVKTFSIRFGSRRIQRPVHQKIRSSTTATPMIDTIKIGHMIGPPLWKFSRMKLVQPAFCGDCAVDGEPDGAGLSVAGIEAAGLGITPGAAGEVIVPGGAPPGDIPGATGCVAGTCPGAGDMMVGGTAPGWAGLVTAGACVAAGGGGGGG